jgi:hypothetical protein
MIAAVVDARRELPAHDGAVVGERDRRLQRLRKRHRAPVREHVADRAERSRHTDAEAVPRVAVRRLRPVVRGRDGHRRRLPPVERVLLAVREVHESLDPAAETGVLRLDDIQRPLHGRRGVECVAALAQDLRPMRVA